MSRYRLVYQCKKCKKVYRSYAKCNKRGVELCPKCGSVDRIETIIAKPKLSGLMGWKIKKR